MNKRSFLQVLVAGGLAIALPASAQSKRYDIDQADVPKSVLKVLDKYVATLRTSDDLDECAKRFTKIAGGSLVNEDGKTLRSSVKRFSLKKDYQNVKFYAEPKEITRVAKLRPTTSGFGPSAIRGPQYKIWLGKKEGVAGRPAPITIMVPKGHKKLKRPRVIRIGSL